MVEQGEMMKTTSKRKEEKSGEKRIRQKEKDDEDEISGKDLMKLIRKAQKKEKNLEKQEKMAEKMDIALTPTREGKTIKRSGSIGENSTREIDGYSQPKKIRRSSDNRHSLLTVIINSYSVFVSYTSSRLYIVVEVLSCLFLSKYSIFG